MFSSMRETFTKMAVCAAFIDRLLDQLREAIPNLPATSEMRDCFHIPLCNGYALSVSIPTSSNRNLTVCTGLQAQCNATASTSFSGPPGVGLKLNVGGTPTDSVDHIIVETVLFKGDNIVYDRDLGYSDVRYHDFNSQAILTEYERLMALLAERD